MMMNKEKAMTTDKKYCENCGSLLGVDCGNAEPDYNEQYCSKGCYPDVLKEYYKNMANYYVERDKEEEEDKTSK
jgi:predicted amidophosphoribosyltransferase